MDYSVLVVDDDDDDFMLLADHIGHCQQNVSLVYAQNGVKATQKLQEGFHPNLILVDVQMPLMDGYEFLVWLMNSAQWHHIPVVIWTGSISDNEVTRYYQAGANSLMLKQEALQDIETFCRHWFKLVQLPSIGAAG